MREVSLNTQPDKGSYKYYADTSFVTGDSPATLDIKTDLGRVGRKGYIINDGAGNFTVAFSTNGTDYGEAITMKINETLNFRDKNINKIKITWVANSAYRVNII